MPSSSSRARELVRRRATASVKSRARLRVEVEAQLVGVVDVVAPHRPRVERDRAELRGPGDDGELGGRDLVGGAAGGERDVRGLDVVGSALRHALLVERLALEALAGGDPRALHHPSGPALERRRPVAQRAQDPVAAREVVLHHLELRDPHGREVRLLGVAHPDDVLAHHELDRVSEGRRHGTRLRATACAEPYSTGTMSLMSTTGRRADASTMARRTDRGAR